MPDTRRTRRLWLYGTALVVLAALAFLWVQRRRADEADRIAYLRGVLGNLDLVMGIEPQAVLDVLDREFADPDLPPDLRRDVLRARALAHAQIGRGDAAEQELDAARALAADDATRAAIRIERALARNATDRRAEALALLEGWSPPADPVLVLYAALARAEALHGEGRSGEAADGLEAALADQAAPLPEGPTRVVAVSARTPRSAARQAGNWLLWLHAADPVVRARILARLDLLDPEGAGQDQGPWSSGSSEDPPPPLKTEAGGSR